MPRKRWRKLTPAEREAEAVNRFSRRELEEKGVWWQPDVYLEESELRPTDRIVGRGGNPVDTLPGCVRFRDVVARVRWNVAAVVEWNGMRETKIGVRGSTRRC